MYLDSEDVVRANEDFVMIHAASGGQKHLRLPRSVDVFDAFSAERLATGVKDLRIPIRQYQTRLLRLSPVA